MRSHLSVKVSRPGWLLLLGPLPLLAMGCVAHDAGYSDVRRSVLDRTQFDVRWRAVDERGRLDERIRRLVASAVTADGAVQVALLNNPDVQGAFEQLGVARAEIMTALRLPNPVLEGAVHFHGDEAQIEVGALIGLNDLLFLATRSGVAQAGLEAAKVGVAGAILDVAFETRTAYYRSVAAGQIVELRRTVLLAASSSYEGAKALHEAGNVTDLDLANERALYEDARLLVARAEAEATTERARLGSLMGLSGTSLEWKTVERLPDADTTRAIPVNAERRALEKSLDLDLARRRFTAAAKRANLARAEGILPELRAGVVAENEANQGWGVGPAAQIELPLFYQGAGEVARARSDMRTQQSLYAAAALQIRAAIQDIVVRLETARAALTFYRDVQLPLREQIMEQTQRQFNAMNISVFQLIQAKRDQIETARAYVETQRDYWIAKAELDQLLAGRLPRAAFGTKSEKPDSDSLPSGRERH